MAKVIDFGSLNMDLSIGCESMPRAGETIVGDGFLSNPGGKGANQAVGLASMGADVRLVGAVGDDGHGSELLEALEGRGVDVGLVTREPGLTTGVAMIVRCAGDNRIIIDPGANDAIDGERIAGILKDEAVAGDWLLVQFECDTAATDEAIVLAHGLGLTTVVNPAPMRPIPDGLWGSIDLLCLNETECGLLTGSVPETLDEAAAAVEDIRAKGAGQVVLTLGGRGSVGTCGDGVIHVPAAEMEVADTTGAGDTYVGALVAALMDDMTMEEAMGLATVAAALACGSMGAQQSIPSRLEVERALKA